MALTDSAVRSAKPAAKAYKLFDERGLFVLVQPTGGKLWRWKYRYLGKEQLLSLGQYPDVSLKDAREHREEARKLLAAGTSPALAKKSAAIASKIASANTFGIVAEEFIAKRESEGLKETTAAKARWFLSLFGAAFNSRPIAEIMPHELLKVLKKIEKRGNRETATRMRAFASRVFRFGVAHTLASADPAAALLGALIAPKAKHHAAILNPVEVGALLRAIDGFQGHMSTKLALRLAPHVFVRPGELRHAEWSEIDLDAAVWRIPAAKMKMGIEHVVPLSRQSIEILREAEQQSRGEKFVFPGVRTSGRPMSENTLNAALRRLGYTKDEMTSHGFRATASTLLNESGKWSSDAIERALAHQERDNIRAAYHRGSHWDERVRMAQWWSDHLDVLLGGAEVVPLMLKGPR